MVAVGAASAVGYYGVGGLEGAEPPLHEAYDPALNLPPHASHKFVVFAEWNPLQPCRESVSTLLRVFKSVVLFQL